MSLELIEVDGKELYQNGYGEYVCAYCEEVNSESGLNENGICEECERQDNEGSKFDQKRDMSW
jgi:hypothetical protein